MSVLIAALALLATAFTSVLNLTINLIVTLTINLIRPRMWTYDSMSTDEYAQCDVMTDIVVIEPMPTYHFRLKRSLSTRIYTATDGTQFDMGVVKGMEQRYYPLAGKADHDHCMTNVVRWEVETVPCMEEQVHMLSTGMRSSLTKASPKATRIMWVGTPKGTPMSTQPKGTPYCHPGMDEYEHMYVVERVYPDHDTMGHLGYTHKGYMHPVDMTLYPDDTTYPSMAADVLKREQEEAMWESHVVLNTMAQMRYRFVHPPTQQDMDLWPDLVTPLPPIKDIWWMIEQKRLAKDENRALCGCGKALGRRADMCYDCYMDQYRTYTESDGSGPLPEKARPYSCPNCAEFICRCGETDPDEANGLCTNCHQVPCRSSFGCYDETEEDRLQQEEADANWFVNADTQPSMQAIREEDLNGFPSWWVIKAYGTDCARCDQHVGYCDCESGPYPPSCGPSSFED